MDWEPGRRREPEPSPVERQVAVFVKHARAVRLLERAHPLGVELRCLHGGALLWSRLIRPGDTVTVEGEVEATRAGLLARGWTEGSL